MKRLSSVWAILIMSLSFVMLSSVMAQTSSTTQTQVTAQDQRFRPETSTNANTALYQAMGMTKLDISIYQEIRDGYLGQLYPNESPDYLLALYALKTGQEEDYARYLEMSAHQSIKRVDDEKQFAHEMSATAERLYPDRKDNLFDQDVVSEMMALFQGKKEKRKTKLKNDLGSIHVTQIVIRHPGQATCKRQVKQVLANVETSENVMDLYFDDFTVPQIKHYLKNVIEMNGELTQKSVNKVGIHHLSQSKNPDLNTWTPAEDTKGCKVNRKTELAFR